jgi:hypothetical protein
MCCDLENQKTMLKNTPSPAAPNFRGHLKFNLYSSLRMDYTNDFLVDNGPDLSELEVQYVQSTHEYTVSDSALLFVFF